MENYILREDYLDKLKRLKDTDIIKIITGIRRCGKSVLLKQYHSYLMQSGIDESQIIYLNFENLLNANLLSYKTLNEFITSKATSGKKMYLLLDEIQEVENFERVVDSLFSCGNYDIYITGSNSHLLSGELSTLLSGRFIEIFVLPFSFREFLKTQDCDKTQAFDKFIHYGGFPYLTKLDDDEIKIQYLDAIYNTIVIKDLQERKRINDVRLLRRVLDFLIDTIGNPISSKKISDTLTSASYKASHVTISNYIQYFLDSYILLKVPRFDVKGKEILSSLEKYYICDLGLRLSSLQARQYNLGSVLENIVYLELIRRGYKCFVGKAAETEIDFIAIKGEELQYFQVCASAIEPSVMQREIAPLLKIKDNNPKTLLTLDSVRTKKDGIENVNIIDWLCRS